jgi:hypothetical protein
MYHAVRFYIIFFNFPACPSSANTAKMANCFPILFVFLPSDWHLETLPVIADSELFLAQPKASRQGKNSKLLTSDSACASADITPKEGGNCASGASFLCVHTYRHDSPKLSLVIPCNVESKDDL